MNDDEWVDRVGPVIEELATWRIFAFDGTSGLESCLECCHRRALHVVDRAGELLCHACESFCGLEVDAFPVLVARGLGSLH